MANPWHTSKNPTDILRKTAALVVTAILIGLALMFSVLIFAAILVVGATAWGYLWWKTRALRKQMRNYPSNDDAIVGEIIKGEIIEGEATRMADPDNGASAARSPAPTVVLFEHRSVERLLESERITPKDGSSV